MWLDKLWRNLYNFLEVFSVKISDMSLLNVYKLNLLHLKMIIITIWLLIMYNSTIAHIDFHNFKENCVFTNIQ